MIKSNNVWVNMQYKKYPLTLKRILAISSIYFILDKLVIVPFIVNLALLNNQNLETLPVEYHFLANLILLLPCFFLSYPLLKNETEWNNKRMFTSLFYLIISLLVLNILFSVLLNFFNIPIDSSNQTGLNQISDDNPLLFIVMVSFMGPLLEEIVFRGVIFRGMREHFHFIPSALFSSLLFGFMHVSAAVFTGNIMEIVYIFLYGGIGFIFCLMYEYNKTIFASIYLHSIYNFISTILMFI